MLVLLMFGAGHTALAADCATPQIPADGTFKDVPPDDMFVVPIRTAAEAGYVTRCGIDFFCPYEVVTREDMAMWVELFIHEGTPATPPDATGVFADVDPSYCNACWIEQIYTDGITAGCSASPLKYCPNRSVTRAQMAVFIWRAMDLRSSGCCPLPTQCVQTFDDVPCPDAAGNGGHWAWPFIQKIHEMGITAGCSASPPKYCPGSAVTRAQMATFLAGAGQYLGDPAP